MRRIMMSNEERIRKKYNRMRIAFAAAVIMLLFVVLTNYNYFVLKLLIAGNYIFTDTLDDIYIESVGEDNFKGYFRNFDEMVIASVTEKIRSNNQDRYTYLYTPQRYQLSREVEAADAKTSKIVEMTPDTVYMTIPNISKYTKDFVYDNKEQLAAYKHLIIDLRSDYGGMLADSYKIADLFLEKGVIIGTEKTRIPFLSSTRKSKGKKYFDFESIIILQNGDTASAAEGLTMALKQNLDNVTIIGTQSFGKGIGQITVPLIGGYAVKGTVLLVGTPDGGTIHGIGITPDITYDKDDITDYAVKYAEGRK